MTPHADAATDALRAHRAAVEQHLLDADTLERGYARTVRAARTHGLTWADIGAALRIDAEAARKRYERSPWRDA